MAPFIMIAAALAGSPGSGTCQQTHIFADGRVETAVVDDDGQGASATASASGRSASSHVSASSSSSAHASASSSSKASSIIDGQRRSVTVTRGSEGCRIVIDERKQRSE